MNINCAACKTAYSITLSEIESIEYRTFKCGLCGHNIKVLACPFCGKLHSISYRTVREKRRTASCHSCHKLFTFSLPPEDDFIPTYRIVKKAAAVSPVKTEEVYSVRDRFFTVRTFLDILKGSFNRKKLLCILLGVAAIIGINFLLQALRVLLPEVLTRYGFFGFIASFVSLFIYACTAACMYWLVVSEKAALKRRSFFGLFQKISQKILLFLGGAFFVVFIFWMAIIVFSNIPRLPPIFFVIVFLPIYLLLFFGGLYSIIGFWLYPYFAAGQNKDAFQSFFSFIKRHFSSAVGMTVFLSLIAGLSLGFISLVVYFVEYLFMKFGAQPGLLSYLTALPSGIRAILDPAAPLRTLFYFEAYRSNASFITGIFIFILSGLLLIWLASWIMGLSAKACEALRRGLSKQDKRFMWICLGSSFCLLSAFYILRYFKVFVF